MIFLFVVIKLIVQFKRVARGDWSPSPLSPNLQLNQNNQHTKMHVHCVIHIFKH